MSPRFLLLRSEQAPFRHTSYLAGGIAPFTLKCFATSHTFSSSTYFLNRDQSVLSQVLRKFRAQHRLLLTGTPLQNNLTELWALLNFLMPKLFDSSEEFEKLFQVDNTLSKQESEEEQAKVIKKIHRLLRPFMLRRLKSDVETNLAPKKEIYLYVGMSTV